LYSRSKVQIRDQLMGTAFGTTYGFTGYIHALSIGR